MFCKNHELPASILAKFRGILPFALIDTPALHLLNEAWSNALGFNWRLSKLRWLDFYEIALLFAILVLNFNIEIHEITMNTLINWR